MNCFSLIFLLKLLGLEPFFSFDTFPNYKEKKYYIVKNVAQYSYSFFIFLLLLYQPISETILTYFYHEIINVPNVLFSYIIPINYYIAYTYFQHQRVKRIYESKNVDFLDTGKGIAKCMPREKTLIKSVLCISLITVVESYITLIVLGEPYIYNYLSPMWKWLCNSIVMLSFIPGRIVLVINSHVFFFSFLQQLQKIQELKDKLNTRDLNENKKSSVAILCYEIIDIRYTLERLIHKTEFMYISTTVLGGISTGLILEIKKWSYKHIISIVLFCILQFLFLIVIKWIGKSRTDINKIVHRRSFASKYILRKNDFCESCLHVEKKFSDLQNSTDYKLHSIHENISDSLSNTSPKNIDTIKIHIENSPILFHKKNLESIDIPDDMFDKDGDTSLDESTEMRKNINKMLEENVVNKKFNLSTKQYIQCIYEWSTNTGSSVDWIILNTLLNEEWATFSLLGFKFKGVKALSSAIMTTTAIIASGSLLSVLASTFDFFK